MRRWQLGILVASILLTAGCDKPKRNVDTLGPVSSPEEIQNAQGKAVQGVTPTEILVGQTAHYTETQELITSEGPVVRLLSEWQVEVLEKETFPEGFVFTTLRSVIDHNDPDKFVAKFKDTYVFAGLPKDAKKEVIENRLSQKLMASETPAKVDEALTITDVTFHNLRDESVSIVPPEEVTKDENCRGLPDCKIQGTRITYDVVFTFSDGSLQKHQIEWQISDQVPFFSSILKQCATTLVSVDNLRVLVKQCQNAVDFTFQ